MKSEKVLILEGLITPESLGEARKQIEDELIELRDARISLPFRNNGLVIKEFDGEPSTMIRLGFEMAFRGVILKRIEAAKMEGC